MEKEKILTESYRAQLKALQAKIDPHFLFNSLNTLQSMVRHQHTNSEQFIICLADFYRHTLKHTEDTTLPLSDELAVLRSYLFLMESRNEGAVRIAWQIDPALQSFHLPTLSLQVAVENCFKHNSLSPKLPLQIEISSTDDHYIKISNNIQPKIGEMDASGYGLVLLKKRYELMGIQKGLVLEKTPHQFCVKLKLI
ncbi:MAG: histidine kinase [Lewinellaceae bacterium]|nr:histidine kinase [Lewinellaceae bacterium]